MKAMIFAAGLGTRLKPWTDHHPKALVPVNGVPVLQRNIEYLQFYGINDIVINVHHFADQIESFLQAHNNFGANITVSDERDEVLETGGGLKRAAGLLENSDPILLMNADILTNLSIYKLLEYHYQFLPLATLAVTNRKTSRYLVFNESNELCGWRNQQTGEYKEAKPVLPTEEQPKAFSGIHLISPQLINLMQQTGKFSIIDVYLSLAGQHTIKGYDHSQDILVDVGRPESITIAEQYFP